MLLALYRTASVLLALLVSSAVVAQQVGSEDATDGKSASGVIESRSLVFDYGNYDPYDLSNLYGFNHAPSIIRLSDSHLQAAWFSGPYEASVHQVILGSESRDGGETWSQTIVLNDAPRLSDFDPAFIDAGERTFLFFSTGRWTRYPFVGSSASERDQVGGRSFRIHMRQRPDNTARWSEPVTIQSEPGWNCRSNGIRLSNGELLLPTHRLDPLPYVASVLVSKDGGKTWARGPDVKTPGRIGAAEPSVTELSNGNLVMALRVSDGRLWLARSNDYGQTWAEPERTELTAAASSSNLFCTSRGQLVLTYTSSAPLRSELSLRTSQDGKSWNNPLRLARIEPPSENSELYNREVCYPSVCELADGSLRVVWAEIEVGAKLQSGLIQSARVRLSEEER